MITAPRWRRPCSSALESDTPSQPRSTRPPRISASITGRARSDGTAKPIPALAPDGE
jgi:hypothetical protein